MIKKIGLLVAIMLPLLCFNACSDDKDDLDKSWLMGTWISESAVVIGTKATLHYEATFSYGDICEICEVREIKENGYVTDMVRECFDATYTISGTEVTISTSGDGKVAILDIKEYAENDFTAVITNVEQNTKFKLSCKRSNK